jgi:integrase
MDIYKRKGTKHWLADFTVNGQRFRKSTGATTKAKAMEVAAELLRQARTGAAPQQRGPMPLLTVFVEERFLPYIHASQLDSDTKRYYETGWRLLSGTHIAGWRMDRITTVEAELLRFPGTGSTANCALRTLRRILSLAREWNVSQAAPRIKLRREKERTAIFTAEREKAFLDVAPQPLKDVFLIVQDSGMRPDEVTRMRWDNVLWDKNLIFVPDGKTEKAKRHVPLSDRVRNLLRVRAQDAKSEWVFPSKRSVKGHISYFPVGKQFSETRKDAGLPDDIVLYSARHSFATDMLDKTGNIVLVGKMLGHQSVTTTQRYLHPELKDIAELVNQRNSDNAKQNLRHSEGILQ